ncbi:MAG TPA: ferredoxin reductase family protein [Woeseiaceae bacterium]|nr:ferredoxin reductase family protein [Woeseiaceae bacterium]
MHIRSWQAVLVIAAISCAVVVAQVAPGTRFTLATLSLSSGVTAFSLMGTAALLGSRWQFIESLFGGLDRVYLTHKWLGVWALGFASFHLAFKAGIGTWDTASIITLPPFYTRLVRQLSFVALMLIVLLALNRKIPYHRWRLWHKSSGPLFLIVILHWLSFESPITLGSAAGTWLATISVLGVAGAGYKLALYPFVSKHAEYRVVGVSPGEDALHLEMAPVMNPVRFEAGQFAFIRMKEDGLREPHPFTIASGSESHGHVNFVIRSLGDYTRKLTRDTRVGMHADVYAPYGRFKRPSDANQEVWIGGGVGISPFISWLTDESGTGFDKVTLFYFFTPGREFPNSEVLADLARRRGAGYVPVAAGAMSPEFTKPFHDIVKNVGAGSVSISFCGPAGLLQAIRATMREHDIPEANLQYEYFEFR